MKPSGLIAPLSPSGHVSNLNPQNGFTELLSSQRQELLEKNKKLTSLLPQIKLHFQKSSKAFPASQWCTVENKAWLKKDAASHVQ